MKQRYEKALILGGVFVVLDLVFRLFPESLSDGTDALWLFGFLMFNVMLAANRPPRFIGYLDERLPDLSLFLKSIGWLPYFIAVFFLGLAAVSLAFNGGEIYPSGMAAAVFLTAAGGIVSVAAYVAMRIKRRKKP